MLTRRTAVAVVLAVFAALLLMLGGPGPASSRGVTPRGLTGRVLAGGHPVGGARVLLYVTEPTGVSTLVGRSRTDGRGRFALSYGGPVARGSVVYAIAAGGGVPDRKAFRLMAVADPTKAAPTTLTLNELTTVAAAYSLAQFLHGNRLTGVNPGLRNAARTVTAFVRPGSGALGDEIAHRPNGRRTTSLATFRTLADLLASCTAGSRHGCRALMSTARARGGARPTNTLAAVHAIASDPGHHARRLYRLDRPAVYRPQLTQAPSSWVLSLKHTAGGFDGPGRMAFDSRGNIWVTNNFQPPGTAAGRFAVALDPTGHPRSINPVTGGGVLGAWWGVAVDQRDHAWFSDYIGDDPYDFDNPNFTGGTAVAEFDRSGTPLSPVDGYQQGGLQGPQGIAVDQQGNVWIANHMPTVGGSDHGSVTEYVGGDPDQARKFTGDAISNPFAVEVDGQGDVWVDNNAIGDDPGFVSEITPADGQIHGPYGQDAHITSPQGMAFDREGNLWVAGMLSNNVTEFAPDGQVVRQVSFPGILGPWSVAVDGADHVWVASFWGRRLTELCGTRTSTCPPGLQTGQPIAPRVKGYTNGGLQHITAVQIDSSGNAWVADNWATAVPITGGDGLVEYVGIAAPVRTPLIGPPRRP